MAKITKIPAKTETKVILVEDEKIVMELSRDEAEAILAVVGLVTPGGATVVDTTPIYTDLSIALEYYGEPHLHRYKAQVTEPGWPIEIVER